MGKVLMLLLIFACVASCSTKRVTTTSTAENATHANETNKIEVLRSVAENTITDTDINERVSTIRTIKFKVYDTEKEADSTGCRPLLAEGEIKESSEKENTLNTNEENHVDKVTTYNSITESDTTTNDKYNDTTVTDKKITNYRVFIYILFVICLALLTDKKRKRL